MQQTVQQHPLKEILTGVTFVSSILLAALYIPVVGWLCSCFIPLPIMYYRLKLGRKPMIILMTLTMLIAIQVYGGLTLDTMFIAELLILGSVMSELVQKKLSVDEIILYTSGLLFIAGLFGLFYYSQVISTGIGTIISDYINHNVAMSINLYRELGMSHEQVTKLSQSLENIVYVLIRIIPSISIALLMILSWLNLLAARTIFQRHQLSFPEFGSLNCWKSPDILVWGVIVSGSIMLIPSDMLTILGCNALIVLMVIYFFQGIAVMSFFFEKKNVSKLVRMMLYSFIVIHQLSLILIIGIGLFDVWADFRKQNPENDQPPEDHQSGFPYDWF
ncbi:conserved hypothetical protein, membrane [Candidatus Magnetomorum sp. HK-1]|nr:conserved hypothetical protein, membrane [Candidatus Magnetomorum sp. HK-1]